MSLDLTSTEQAILLVFCGFVVAINLSLVFAFVHRKRDQASSAKPLFSGVRMPWHSKYQDESAELTRRVDELRKTGSHAGEEKDRQNSS